MTGKELIKELQAMDDSTLDKQVLIITRNDMTLYTDQCDAVCGIDAVEDGTREVYPILFVNGDPKSMED